MHKIIKSILVTIIIFNSLFIKVGATTVENKIEKEANDMRYSGLISVFELDEGGYTPLYSQAFNDQYNTDYDSQTLFSVGSISKVYTAVGILQLVESGQISLEDTLPTFFSNVPVDKQNITVKQLLTHTAGFALSEDETPRSKEDSINRIMESTLSFLPGDNYFYSNEGYTLLTAIIEEASNQEYEQYMKENIFDRLNLKNTGFPIDEQLVNKPQSRAIYNGLDSGALTDFQYDWSVKGYSNVITNEEELLKFFHSIIYGQILTQEMADQMLSIQTFELNRDYWGLGVNVREVGDKLVYGHAGVWYGGNSMIQYDPSNNTLVICLSDTVTLDLYYPAIAMSSFIINNKLNEQMSPIGEYQTISYNELKGEEIFTSGIEEEQPQTTVPLSQENDNNSETKILVAKLLGLSSILIIVLLIRRQIKIRRRRALKKKILAQRRHHQAVNARHSKKSYNHRHNIKH